MNDRIPFLPLPQLLNPPPAGHASSNLAETPQNMASSGSTKKRKSVAGEAQPKTKKTRRGRLYMFVDIPMDILFETLKYLAPFDLLQLARSSKNLREKLLDRASITVWQAALANVDTPEMPDDISEVAWTRLLFEKRCHICTVSEVKTIQWEVRKRICKRCFKSSPLILSCAEAFKAIETSRSKYPESVIDGSDILRRSTSRIRKYLSFRGEPDVDNPWKARYFKPLLEEDIARLGEVTHDESEYRARLERMAGSAECRAQHANCCRAWEKLKHENRADELENMRNDRVNMIFARLHSMGWADTLLHCTPALLEHKRVQGTYPVTDKSWKSIYAELEPFLQEQKDTFIRVARATIMEGRALVLAQAILQWSVAQPFKAILPSLEEFLRSPLFLRIIKQEPVIGGPPVTQQAVVNAVASIPQVTLDWRAESECGLLAMLEESFPGQALQMLRDIGTVFRCQYCQQRLLHPMTLVHRCIIPGNHLGDQDADPVFNIVRNVSSQQEQRFTGQTCSRLLPMKMSICETSTTVFQSVLAAYYITNRIELRSLNPYVVVGPLARRWSEAVLYTYGDIVQPTYRLPAAAELQVILSSRHQFPVPIPDGEFVACAHCRLTGTKKIVMTHLRKEHLKEHPTDKDLQRSLDNPPRYRDIDLSNPEAVILTARLPYAGVADPPIERRD